MAWLEFGLAWLAPNLWEFVTCEDLVRIRLVGLVERGGSGGVRWFASAGVSRRQLFLFLL